MATGMVSPISQKELDETYKRLAPKYQGRKEDYFTLLYMKKEFGIPEAQTLLVYHSPGTSPVLPKIRV